MKLEPGNLVVVDWPDEVIAKQLALGVACPEPIMRGILNRKVDEGWWCKDRRGNIWLIKEEWIAPRE